MFRETRGWTLVWLVVAALVSGSVVFVIIRDPRAGHGGFVLNVVIGFLAAIVLLGALTEIVGGIVTNYLHREHEEDPTNPHSEGDEMSDALKMVKLKNGGEAPESAIRTTMVSLQTMMKEDISSMLAVVDLAEHCREGTEVTGKSRELLVNIGLMESDGRVHDAVRDIVLSASEGEGLSFRLSSPYAEE